VFSGVAGHYKKSFTIAVQGGLAQKASVCLLHGRERRKKKHMGCIHVFDGETMKVQHKSYRKRRRSHRGSDGHGSLLGLAFSWPRCSVHSIAWTVASLLDFQVVWESRM